MSTRSRHRFVNPFIELGTFSTSATGPTTWFRNYSGWDCLEFMTDTSPHKYLSGGGFSCTKTSVTEDPAYVDCQISAPPGWRKYTGRIYCTPPRSFGPLGGSLEAFKDTSNNWPLLYIGESNSSLLNSGEKGWRRFKPTARNGSLGQAILELKDLPEMLEQSNIAKQLAARHKNFLKLGGKQYLNAVFGWAPFLSDVRDFVKNSVNVQRRIDQLARDNGKKVRRSGTVSTTSSTYVDDYWAPCGEPLLDTYFYNGYSHIQSTLEIGQRRWFSAAFRYNIQKPTAGALGDFLLQTHVNAILYGDDLSPSLLWEVTPWSWLVDWWSSAGDSLANFFEDSADNLVGEYAYIMCSSFNRYTVAQTHYLTDGKAYQANGTWDYTCKQRLSATPYGFYADVPDLTPKQIGILVALGLTKRIHGYQ